MKAVVSANDLLQVMEGMKSICLSVQKARYLPMLAHVKVTAIQGAVGEIQIFGTNLDVCSTEKIAAHVETEGTMSLQAKTTLLLLRELPLNGAVTLEVRPDAKGWGTISCDGLTAKMACFEADDFPNMREDKRVALLPRKPLKEPALKKTKRPKGTPLPKPGTGEDATLRCWYGEIQTAFKHARLNPEPDNILDYFMARDNYRQLCRLRGLPVDYRAETQRDIKRRTLEGWVKRSG